MIGKIVFSEDQTSDKLVACAEINQGWDKNKLLWFSGKDEIEILNKIIQRLTDRR